MPPDVFSFPILRYYGNRKPPIHPHHLYWDFYSIFFHIVCEPDEFLLIAVLQELTAWWTSLAELPEVFAKKFHSHLGIQPSQLLKCHTAIICCYGQGEKWEEQAWQSLVVLSYSSLLLRICLSYGERSYNSDVTQCTLKLQVILWLFFFFESQKVQPCILVPLVSFLQTVLPNQEADSNSIQLALLSELPNAVPVPKNQLWWFQRWISTILICLHFWELGGNLPQDI